MGVKFDRFYHQFFVLPYLGITYGRPNGKHMLCICFGWLCFGVIIGFKKAKQRVYGWGL